MEQATLWQDENQEPRSIHLGDTFEMGFCWADGDTDSVQLERLAQLKEGQRDWIQDTQGGWHPVYILRTWVDKKRKCARGLCEAIRYPLSGRNSYDPNEIIGQQENDEDEAC